MSGAAPAAAGGAAGAVADPLAPAAEAGTGGKLGVRVVSWQAVAAWTWNAGDDVCGICRNAFDACPPDAKFPGDDSPVVWGACGHAYHLQCITKWLASQTEQRCAICRQNWEFKAILRLCAMLPLAAGIVAFLRESAAFLGIAAGVGAVAVAAPELGCSDQRGARDLADEDYIVTQQAAGQPTATPNAEKRD